MSARRQVMAVGAGLAVGLAALASAGCGDGAEGGALCPAAVVIRADGGALQTGRAEIDACLALAADARALYQARRARLRQACAAIVVALDPDVALPDTGDPMDDTRQTCLLAGAFVDTVLAPDGSLFCIREATCDTDTLSCSAIGSTSPATATLESALENAGAPICSADCYLPDEALHACASSLIDGCSELPAGGCDCATGAYRAYTASVIAASDLLVAVGLATGNRITCAAQR